MSTRDDLESRQHARHAREEQLVELQHARALVWGILDRLDDNPVAVAALIGVIVDIGHREDSLLDRLGRGTS